MGKEGEGQTGVVEKGLLTWRYRDHPRYDEKTDSIDGVPVRASMEDFLTYVDKHASPTFRETVVEEGFKVWKETQSPLVQEGKQWAPLRDARSAEEARQLDYSASEWMMLNVQLRTAKALKAFEAKAQETPFGQFSILGVDFLIAEDGQCWLLEFTKSPAYRYAPLWPIHLVVFLPSYSQPNVAAPSPLTSTLLTELLSQNDGGIS